MKKVVLLTGYSSGIGKSIFERLLTLDDYFICGIARKTTERKHPNDKTRLYSCDLSNIDELKTIVKDIEDRYNHIDILINNAGAGLFKNIEDINIEEWDYLMNLNLTAPFFLMKSSLVHMKKSNFGRIINITSDADHITFSQGSAYCASKFGLKALSDCARKETAGFNIKITTISPGKVDTCFNNKHEGDRPHSLNANDVASVVIHILQTSVRCEIENISLNSTLEKELH